MRRAVPALCAALVVFAACGDGGDPQVTMNGERRFAPEEITVGRGQTITFVNESDEQHTVTAYDDGIPEGARYFASGGFPSEDAARDDPARGFIPAGEPYSITLRAPGTYEYFCIPHEPQGMTGTIVIE
jgi:plastocyanin